MTTARRRFLAGALTLTLLAASLPHHAAANSYPWFGLARGTAADAAGAGISLLWSFRPFWHYHDGFPWTQYAHLRETEQGVPAIYTARSATPLPSLPARPEGVTVSRSAGEGLKERLPAPAPVKPPAPAPSPSPEPAPQPPQPEPAPEPPAQPAPQPKPEPAPQPAPEPAPKPEPAPPPAPAGLTDEERELVNLVNAERAKAGLPALQVDLRLVATARVKSQDMITYNYFSHDSARLGSPFDQMKAAGITYRTAGENIAGNRTVAGAHQSLMNSPGHRANILSTKFTKIGIGIMKGGPYGMMFTQQFIGD